MKPWTVLFAILVVILSLAGIEIWNRAIAQHATAEADRRHAVTMDSVREANAMRDTLAVRALADYARAKLHGDSLQKALQGLARKIRTRTLPGRVDTLLVPDTATGRTICMDEGDGRALLVGDSARQVREDSLARGWEVCRMDSTYLAQRPPVPSSPSAWTKVKWFGAGLFSGWISCELAR